MLDRLLIAPEYRLEENIREPGPDDPHDPHEARHDDVRVVERFVRQRPREALRDVRRDGRLGDDHPDEGPHGHVVDPPVSGSGYPTGVIKKGTFRDTNWPGTTRTP